MGDTVAAIKKLCPKSTVLGGIAIRGGSVGSAQKDVEKWLASINISPKA